MVVGPCIPTSGPQFADFAKAVGRELHGELGQAFARRHACTLKVLAAECASGLPESVRKLWEDGFPAPLGQSLVFPIGHPERLMGVAEIHGAIPRSGRARQRLVDWAEMTIELALWRVARRQQIAQRLEATSQWHQAFGAKVIPLRRVMPQARPAADLAQAVLAATDPRRGQMLRLPKSTTQVLSSSALVEGRSHDDLRRMAMEIHELSGRAAFVEFEDLELRTPQDLEQLDGVTVFVPEVMLAPQDKLKLLIDHMARGGSQAGAKIVVGSVTPSSELKSLGGDIADVVRHASGLHFRAPQALGGPRRGSITKLILDSLSD